MADAKKLAGYTTVNGTTYGPDDDVPADAAKEITNPKAFDAKYDNRTPAQVKADEVAAQAVGAKK